MKLNKLFYIWYISTVLIVFELLVKMLQENNILSVSVS